MIFSINILGAPFSRQSTHSAYQFAEAALAQGHSIYRVFFYSDAAHVASDYASPPQDEINIGKKWQALAQNNQIDLVVCVAAGIRRGILNATEAKRYGKAGHNLLDGYDLSGLGQLIDAAIESDRLVTFGS
jgi:tRNA 2-thiouridine synthesizing protein D